MERATVVPFKAEMSSFISRALTGALLSFFLCLGPFTLAMAADQERAFERSGIHFPGGFDLNTVGGVSGKIAGLYRPSGTGPIILELETTWEKYAVVTCPPWYWDELKIKISAGEEAHVTGSKSLGKDSRLYIIAQEIHLVGQGKTIMLRNKVGTPLWSGQHGKAPLRRGSGRTGGQR